MGQQQALAQHSVGGLGQRVAFARAEPSVLAEKRRDHRIGRLVGDHRTADEGQAGRRAGDLSKGVRDHHGIVSRLRLRCGG